MAGWWGVRDDVKTCAPMTLHITLFNSSSLLAAGNAACVAVAGAYQALLFAGSSLSLARLGFVQTMLGPLDMPQSEFTTQWKLMCEQLRALQGEVLILQSQVIGISTISASFPKDVERKFHKSHGLISKEQCLQFATEESQHRISSRLWFEVTG